MCFLFGVTFFGVIISIRDRIQCNSNIIHRLADLEVRVADSKPLIPNSQFSEDEKFTEGEILGTFEGPGLESQIIKIEASNAKLIGKYVIFQMNQGKKTMLQLHEVMVFGTPAE